MFFRMPLRVRISHLAIAEDQFVAPAAFSAYFGKLIEKPSKKLLKAEEFAGDVGRGPFSNLFGQSFLGKPLKPHLANLCCSSFENTTTRTAAGQF